MGSGVAVTFLGFHYMSAAKQKTLLSDNKVCLGEAIKMGTCSANTVIDWKLIVGSLMFGAGTADTACPVICLYLYILCICAFGVCFVILF
jgi:hypothetical protein